MINAAKEAIELLLETIGKLLFEFFKVFLPMKESFDDVKNEIIGAIFGVPGTVVAVITAIITAVGIIIVIAKKLNRDSVR